LRPYVKGLVAPAHGRHCDHGYFEKIRHFFYWPFVEKFAMVLSRFHIISFYGRIVTMILMMKQTLPLAFVFSDIESRNLGI